MRYWFEKQLQHWATRIVWRLPRWVIYWATVRLAVEDWDGNPGERKVVDAMNAWRSVE